MSNDPEQIRREIERTRTELSDNVNALGDKVNPGSIAKRQVGRVRGAATSVKDAVLGSDSDPTDTGPPPEQLAGDRSLGELISEVTGDLSTLMRQELELAKAEVQQSASRAGKGAGMLGGAAVAGYFVLLFGSIALWWAIGAATGLGWSALIVAVLWGIIAAVLAVTGRNSLKSVGGIPKTTSTVKKIPDALKGNE